MEEIEQTLEQLDNSKNQQKLVVTNNSTNKIKQEFKLNKLKDNLIKFGFFIKTNLPIYVAKTKQQLKPVLQQICKTTQVLWFKTKPYLIKSWRILIAQSKCLIIKLYQIINNKIMQLKQIRNARKAKKLNSSSYAGELKK